jgi:hypothetical protein
MTIPRDCVLIKFWRKFIRRLAASAHFVVDRETCRFDYLQV